MSKRNDQWLARKARRKAAARARIEGRRTPPGVLPGVQVDRPAPSREVLDARAAMVAKAYEPWAGAHGVDRTARFVMGR
jgi:hypothetical protein